MILNKEETTTQRVLPRISIAIWELTLHAGTCGNQTQFSVGEIRKG